METTFEEKEELVTIAYSDNEDEYSNNDLV